MLVPNGCHWLLKIGPDDEVSIDELIDRARKLGMVEAVTEIAPFEAVPEPVSPIPRRLPETRSAAASLAFMLLGFIAVWIFGLPTEP